MDLRNIKNYLVIFVLASGIVAFCFSTYQNIKSIPEVKAAVTGHEKRITTIEAKMDYVVIGIDKILKRVEP